MWLHPCGLDGTVLLSWWSFARAYYFVRATCRGFWAFLPSHKRTYTRSRAQVGRRLPASSQPPVPAPLVARPPPQRPFRGRRSRHSYSYVRLNGEAPTSCTRWHLIVGEAGGRPRGGVCSKQRVEPWGYYVRYWTCTSSGVNGKLTPADVRSRVCFWPASAPADSCPPRSSSLGKNGQKQDKCPSINVSALFESFLGRLGV